MVLGALVGGGDEIGRALQRDLQIFDFAEVADETASRLARGGDHHVQGGGEIGHFVLSVILVLRQARMRLNRNPCPELRQGEGETAIPRADIGAVFGRDDDLGAGIDEGRNLIFRPFSSTAPL